MFLNAKKTEIPNMVDTGAKDSVMVLNYNEQEPGGINKYTDVDDDQEPRHFFTSTTVNDSDTDSEMGLNNYAILKQINVLNGTQDYPS